MKTNQEIQSAIIKLGYDITNWLSAITPFAGSVSLFAGHLNTGREAVPCPKCDAKHSWEDIE